MKVIRMPNKVIYRPDEGKLLKFKQGEQKYEEIVLKEESDIVIEVDKEDSEDDNV